MESRGKAALAGIALLAVFAAAYIVRSGGEDEASGPQVAAESTRPPRARLAQNTNTKNTKRIATASGAGEDAPALPEAARSLRGTDIDGALRVGPDGKLILGPEVVRFFEYFLAATGEESDAVIRARIEAAIRERLDGPAEAEALALFNKYMAYREAGRNIAVPPGSDGDPMARLEAVKKLRREHFGEEAASLLFGEEELQGQVAAERSRIMKDPDLSPEERNTKLAELEAKLPEGARDANEAATRALRLREDEAALRAKGASEDEIHRHRVEAVGEEAADRLRDLDRKRAEWKGRIETFRAERDRIAKQYSDEGARQAAEAKLFEESFEPEERARAKAVVDLPR